MKSWVFIEILTGTCPVILAGKPGTFTLRRLRKCTGVSYSFCKGIPPPSYLPLMPSSFPSLHIEHYSVLSNYIYVERNKEDD